MKPATICLITASALLLVVTACRKHSDTQPQFPEQPSHEAYPGFSWETVSGAGLQCWAQRGGGIRVVPDGRSSALCIVYETRPGTPKPLLQVFTLRDGRMESLLEQLAQTPGWDPAQTCTFAAAQGNRPGVTRYNLVPTGTYADSVKARCTREPVPSTCNGWGMGNSGTRYFEVHAQHPDKAVFVEIGQDQPLFDERSIVLTGKPDSTALVQGELIIGHEVRSFTASGDTLSYWVHDPGGQLCEAYDRLTGGMKNGTPVTATLRVTPLPRSTEGFAADYDGVYRVEEVIALRR